MFERFTDQSRRAVVLAREEAARLDHDHIGKRLSAIERHLGMDPGDSAG